ncbi:MAG TPA: hypothetical protein DD640_08000 [Clostridiales bacterium]|nr:hypothetical protein [Clostridiales bacterium]
MKLLFFIMSLVLSLTVSGVLLAALIKSLKINWERRNHRPVGYLAPVFIMMAFIALTVTLTAPRLLDIPALVAQTYIIDEIELQQEDISWSTINSGGRRFFYNQWKYKPQPDTLYRISYTEHSRYIVELAEISESAGSGK